MSESTPATPGLLITFYSFKGGVGRSMTLANVAAWLSKWGQSVLVVDWDLEAPGIEKYFQKWLRGSASQTDGIVDLVHSFARGQKRRWEDCLLHADPPRGKTIDFLCAGRDDAEYVSRLRSLDWEELFSQRGFGNYLEELRGEWAEKYKFVLIDSRTGVTDIGGICAIHLPDVVVVMFTANDQSLVGAQRVLASARLGHASLPVDRRRLLFIPVPSRDESNSEYKLAEEWRAKFASVFADYFEDWVPQDETPTSVLNYLKIPYFPYWSFGERVPVLEEEDPDNPKTLAFAYQAVAKLILGKVNWKEAQAGVRASEEAQRQAAEAERARLETVKVMTEARQREAARFADESHRKLEERRKRFGKYIDQISERRGLWSNYQAHQRTNTRRWGALIVGIAVAGFIAWIWMWNSYFYRVAIPVASSALLLATAAVVIPQIKRVIRLAGGMIELLDRELAAFRAGGPLYLEDNAESRFTEFAKRMGPILAISPSVLSSWQHIRDVEARLESWMATPPFATESAELGDVSSMPGTVRPSPISIGDSSVVPHDYSYDVFISFAQQAVVSVWIEREFLPLFSYWLAEELGRKPKLFESRMPQPEIEILTSSHIATRAWGA